MLVPRLLSRVVPIILFSSFVSDCQQAQSSRAASTAGSDWASVRALPANTKIHVTRDHGGITCRVFSVNDDTLTCAKGARQGLVLQREEIQHIKLAHYGRSALVGAGIGAGGGAIFGAIVGRNTCKTGQFCFNIISSGSAAAIFAVPGLLLGSGIGFGTDLARGSSIYTKP